MPSSTTIRTGSDFRALVQNSVATQERLQRQDRGSLDQLRERVREIGQDLRNWGHAAPAEASPRANGLVSLRNRLTEHWTLAAARASALTRQGRERLENWRARRAVAPEPDWQAELEREFHEQFGDEAAPAREKFWAGWGEAAALRGAQAARLATALLTPFWRVASVHSGFLVKTAACGLVCLGALGLAQNIKLEQAPAEASAPIARQGEWVDISKPYQLFTLPAPQLAHEKPTYAARRHTAGGGREDHLTFGEFSGRRAFLRLSFYRHGQEPPRDSSFFVDMARRAALLGLSVGRADVEQALKTRFGEFESAGLGLSEGPLLRKNCRGFRLEMEKPGLTIAGLACGAGDEPMGAAELACWIERLDLVAAGDDAELARFFGAALAKGAHGCPEAARRKTS